MPATVLASRQVPAGGGSSPTVTTVTAATYTMTQTDGVLRLYCNSASNAITVNLAAVAGNTCEVVITKTSAANTVTVDGSGAELIDGATTAVLTAEWESITLTSNGSFWAIS